MRPCSRKLIIGLKSRSIGADVNNSPYLDLALSPLALALPRMLTEIETALATAGPVETRRLRQRADLIRELLTPRPTEPLSTYRGLNRIVGPAPALRQSLRAASAQFERGASAALAASRFRQPASPRARDAIPPCEHVWSRNRRQRGVWSRFLPSTWSSFWWRSMARGLARNDRKVVDLQRQVSPSPAAISHSPGAIKCSRDP